MPKHRIAIDSGITNYRPILENEGFEVVDLTAHGPAGAEAVLLSGISRNVMGDENRVTGAMVFDVSGRQPEEVVYDLRKHFRMAEGE